MLNCFDCGGLKSRNAFLVFLALFLSSYSQLKAQQSFQHFNHINDQDGLANNIVYDVVADHNGYLWIATAGQLQRYDGTRFISYGSSNAQIPNAIRQVHCDRNNNIWLIGDHEVFVLDRALDTFRSTYKAAQNALPEKVFEDSQSTLWLLTRDGQLFFYDTDSSEFVSYHQKWKLTVGTVHFLQQDRKSGIYWLSDGRNLFALNAQTSEIEMHNLQIAFHHHIDGRAIEKVTALHVDKSGRLWLAFASGTGSWRAVYDIKSKEWVVANATFTSSFFTTVEDITWATGSELSSYTSGKWNSVSSFGEHPYEFSDVVDSVYSITEDRDGVLWAGTDQGLFVFAHAIDKFLYYPLNAKKIFPFGNNSLVVINEDNSVTEYDTELQKKSEILPASNRKMSERVVCVGQEQDLWIFNDDKLLSIADNAANILAYKITSIGDAKVVCIDADGSGKIWIATADGFLHEWEKSSERVIRKHQLKNGRTAVAMKLISDEGSNTLWVVSNSDIQLLQRHSGRILSSSIEGRITHAVYFESGKLLVGTEHGLYVAATHSDSVVSVQPIQHLRGYHVTGLIQDASKNMWITTLGNGLYQLSPTLKELKEFSEDDGVVFRGFKPAVGCLVNGQIYLATTRNILSFDPVRIRGPIYNPRVEIVSFRVNGVEIPLSKTAEVLELDWMQNTIGVDFSSMSTLYKDRVEYLYRLEGFDREWSTAREGERIKFTQLPAGNYTFRVQSKVLSGGAIADEARIVFRIKAAFWTTAIFKLIIAVTLITIVVLFFWRRDQKRKRIQHVKDKISRDLHDHIGSSLSAINLLIDIVRSSLPSNPDKASSLLKKIALESQITQENLHDIVWSMAPGNATMQRLIDRMKEFAHDMFGSEEVQLSLAFDDRLAAIDLPLERRYDLYLIFKEVLNNGAKYADASRVNINMQVENGIVHFKYTDDGNGFDEQRLTRVNGLINMRQRAAMLKGELTIQSSPGNGTTIKLLFPVSKAHR